MTTTNGTGTSDPAAISSLQSLKYSNEGGNNPKLSVLDQLLLPHEKVYIDVTTAEEAFDVIKKMQIRGEY